LGVGGRLGLSLVSAGLRFEGWDGNDEDRQPQQRQSDQRGSCPDPTFFISGRPSHGFLVAKKSTFPL
jgi:hypothetical protein